MEERLRKFAALVEVGSFTKAAEALHVSQPALSASIKKLERELKEPLLIRGTQPLALTPAGELAYTTSKEIRISTSNLTNKLEQLRQQKPSLSIGMIDSIAQAVFNYSSAFSDLDQSAHVSLIVDNSRNLPTAVRRGELDIAFVVEPGIRGSEEMLQYSAIGAEPLVTVCIPEELSALQRAVAKGTLSPFISYDKLSNTYRLVNQAYARTNVKLHPTFYSTSPSVTLQLTLAGRGASSLPYMLVASALKDGSLIRLPVGETALIDRPIVCITQRGRELPELLLSATKEVRHTLHSLHEEATQIDK